VLVLFFGEEKEEQSDGDQFRALRNVLDKFVVVEIMALEKVHKYCFDFNGIW
jgi:hypothetical protein